ncbi:SDR family NAD(P)-dependent oxidoreductase [Bowmanella dokdonensis]|uniref:SDR family NAD(P)-dependent oxidoreductase n=1 Tax=Bowmanella dokdonensis TaxID=751969 RepID=A0A939DQC2_9ALTE|nr:SDR family NAD(P)-dependent oxidoreductase [Bowmanella dokdonensis]MBN7826270.1 SDR family NAD(P)-dependent oxidoreductase [Bowmanella dokdonensis]
MITGANRGIGYEIAKGLAALGHIRVLVAARHEPDAEAAAKRIGRSAVGVELTLNSTDRTRMQAQAIQQVLGPVDILVNNAGVMLPGDAMQTSLDNLNQSLATHTIGPFTLSQIFAEGMQARQWGRIVNLSSGWGCFYEGLEGPAAYSISKAALNAVTVCFARALGPCIKVNAACPGWVRTRMGGEEAPRSAEEGAQTPIWLATLDDEGPTGKLFRDKREIDW